jgi:hybrid polyketide synthase/nonribosomal peptide synthetase ACE1
MSQQSTHLTYAAPDDGESRSIYIPKRIKRLTFNPDLCTHARSKQTALAFDAAQPIELPHANKLCDINLYPDYLDNAMIRVQGLECVPFSRQTVKDDREAFSNIVWDVLDPDARAIIWDQSKTSGSLELAGLLERVAGFYLRRLDKEVPKDHPSRYEAPYKGLLQYVSNISSQSCTARSQLTQAHWDHDTPEIVAAVCEPYADTIDMKLVVDCGKNLASSVMAEKFPGDVSGLMKEWYSSGSGVKAFTTHLAGILKQMVHRYPQMHILEVGQEVGTATNVILSEIGPRFASYTIAASTETSFDPEQALPDTYKAKVIPKVLNLSQNPRDQGFTERSFDVVVASLILHQSPELEQSLRNARRLLKPGGHLIVLELRPSLPYFLSVVFGADSHQWFNAEEGRASFPAVTLSEWDSLLRKTGFSGIDTSTVDEHNIGVPFDIFVSQAMDEKIAFLREPLLTAFSVSSSEPTIQDLLILGGKSSKTARLVNQLSSVLKGHCGSLRTARSMDSINVEISPKTIILSLTDLDASEFKELDEPKWDALKKLVSHTGTLVWVTHGRLADNPHANMMLGLLRGAARDNSTLDYLLLDIEDSHRIEHNLIAETILRHKAASQWRERESIISYSVESELVMDKTGRLLIPRLMMNERMNDRYNSNWRQIRELARPSLDNIAISTSDSGWDVVLEPLPPGGRLQLRTTHSLLSPIRVASSGCMYVSLSSDKLSGDKIIALSSKNNSVVTPQEELSIPVKVPPGSEARFLWLTAHYLLASSILKGLSQDDQVLVHEPSLEFSTAIAEEASILGVENTFTTTNNDTPDNWIALHPFALGQPMLSRLADENFSVFVDMTPQAETESVADLVASALPPHCRKESLGSLFGNKAWTPKGSHVKEIQTRLLRAVSWASGMLNRSHCEHMTSFAIDGLPETAGQLEPFSIIEWDTVPEVSVKVQPVDTLVSFSDKKTYWLVGLTGGLGLSLCEWMVQRGARYFAISSRKPNVEKAWLDGMDKKGVQVKISAWLVKLSDKESGFVFLADLK